MNNIKIENLDAILEVVSHDNLTNAFTKKFFALQVQKDLQNRINSNTGYLFFCDLNNLNQLNNIYNHQRVNNYIVNIYNELQNMFKLDPEVLFSRVGDEFLIYSPNCNDEQMKEVDKQIKSIRFKSTNSVMNSAISSGSVSIHEKTCEYDIMKLLLLADSRMQEYKNKIRIENLKNIYTTNYQFINGFISAIFDKIRIQVRQLSELQLKELPNMLSDIAQNYNAETSIAQVDFDNPILDYDNILNTTQVECANIDCDAETISKLALLKYLGTFNQDVYSHDYFTKCYMHILDESHTTLTLIDTSFLKEINDAKGHEYSDKQILALSNTLSITCQDIPNSLIIRKGAAEFYIISEKLTSEQTAKIYHNLEEYNSKHELCAHFVIKEIEPTLKNSSENIFNFLKMIEEAEEDLVPKKTQYKYSNLQMSSVTIVKMMSILDVDPSRLKEYITDVVTQLSKTTEVSKDEEIYIDR